MYDFHKLYKIDIFKIGDEVTIRSMIDPNKILAVGEVRSLDSMAKVGDTPLGSR